MLLVRVPRKSLGDTPRRSTLAASSEGTQGVALPPSDASSMSSQSRKAGRDPCMLMMEQVEANIALLIAEHVPPTFIDFATTTVVAAYPRF